MTDRVTLRDVYDAVGRLETKFDSRFDRIEARTSVLENFQAGLKGQIALVLFAINLAIIAVIEFIKEQLKIRL